MVLSTLIGAVLSDRPAYADVRAMVDLCHRFAVIYVHTRVGRTDNPAVAGLRISDVATDCIASLFERSHTGAFTTLRHYFRKTAWQTLGEEDLMILLRRLVFGRVNQELCNLWKLGDPSLAKLVRNLKAAVDKSPRLANRRFGNEPWIVLKSVNGTQESSLIMSVEFFEAHFSGALPEAMNMCEVAERIAEVFDFQEWYKKGLPLMDVATGVRNAFARAGAALAESEEEDAQSSAVHQAVLRNVVRNVQMRLEDSFVGRGRVTLPDYEAYFRSIFEALNEEFIVGNGHDQSLFDYLHKQSPSLQAADFRRSHKSHMEYLFRLTKMDFLSSLKKTV